MFSRRELLDAIAECENNNPSTYPECAKLATFYTLYDHLYPEEKEPSETVKETLVGAYGETEFLQAVDGCDAENAWRTMDELMSTLKVMQPRMYNAILVKIGQNK